MDETPTNGVEALVRDAVAEQRQKGLMPTPNAVKEYLIPIVSEGDAKTERARLRIKPNPVERDPDEVVARRSTEAMEKEHRRLLARKGHEPLPGPIGWTETRKPADVQAVPRKRLLSKRDALAKSRFRKRLRLLLSKPDWREKLKQVNPLALNGQLGFEKQQQADQYVRQIFLDSNRLFGDWLAEPAKKLWFP